MNDNNKDLKGYTDLNRFFPYDPDPNVKEEIKKEEPVKETPQELKSSPYDRYIDNRFKKD